MSTPAPIIETVGKVTVLRDDLIAGGTKRRIAGVLMRDGDEFVYAGPCCGYAQLAVALTAKDFGKRCTMFVACRANRHKLTAEAEAAGAKIVEVAPGYLSVVRSRAAAYCNASGAVLIPFGLDCETFIAALADFAAGLPIRPREVWSVAGSGALTRSLQRAWPAAKFFAVRVGKSGNCGNATVIDAPERFEQAAKQPPPFPSCDHYDAKAWQFIQRQASPGAFFWNVGA